MSAPRLIFLNGPLAGQQVLLSGEVVRLGRVAGNTVTVPDPSVSSSHCEFLVHGAEVIVRSGPEAAGELKWWKVSTPLGDGWAAEDYLQKKP